MQGVQQRPEVDAGTLTDRLDELTAYAAALLRESDALLRRATTDPGAHDVAGALVMHQARFPAITAALREAAAGCYFSEQSRAEGISIGLRLGEERAAEKRARHRKQRPFMQAVPAIALAAIPLRLFRAHTAVRTASVALTRIGAAMRHKAVVAAIGGTVALTGGAAVAVTGTYSLAPYATHQGAPVTRIEIVSPAAAPARATAAPAHPAPRHTPRAVPEPTPPASSRPLGTPSQAPPQQPRSAAPALTQLAVTPAAANLGGLRTTQLTLTATGNAGSWTAAASPGILLSAGSGPIGLGTPVTVTITVLGAHGHGTVTFTAPGTAPVTVAVTWGT